MTSNNTHPANLAKLTELVAGMNPDYVTTLTQSLVALQAGAPAKSAAGAERFKVHSAREALEPQPPIDWVVDGLISAGSLTLLFGDAGSKKTWAALAMTATIATGQPFLAMPTRQRGALLVDEESGSGRLKRRLGEVMRGYCAGPDAPIWYITRAGLNLRDPGDVDELRAVITATGVGFVVVDALCDATGDADENSVREMRPAVAALHRLAEETNAAIVLIHHTSKSGGYRGSTAIKAEVDLQILVESKSDSPNVDFSTDKARDFIGATKFSAVCTWDPEGPDRPAQFYMLPTDGVGGQRMGKADRYVLRYLGERPTASTQDVMHHADTCAASSARNALFGLADRGAVKRVDQGGPGITAMWQLTDQGRTLYENL